MPETPRSSKRRRLNGNGAAASSPLPASKTASTLKSSRKSLVTELDVYDDIDGALEAGSTTRRRSARKSVSDDVVRSGRAGKVGTKGSRVGQNGDEHDEATKTQKRNTGSSSLLSQKKPPSASRRAKGIRNLETTAGLDVDNEHDELDGGASDEDIPGDNDGALTLYAEQQLLEEAAAAASPSKRQKGRKAINRGSENDMMEDVLSESRPRKGRGLFAQSPGKIASPSKDSRRLSSKTLGIEEIESIPKEKQTPRRGRKPKVPLAIEHSEEEMDIGPPSNSQGHLDIEIQTATWPASAQPVSPQIKLLKEITLSKLTSRRPIPLTNLKSEYTKVHTLLDATIQSGESNSMLLIGSRGSGKTALINAALQDLSRSSKEHFHVVRLNGFIQTDDKLALREIWRQLGREMEIDEDESSGPGKSYADTLTMLLALLSHPEEITGQALSNNELAKSIIFIMDEFDLFATHPRQTLLYNLLDIAQSRKAPIAVLGLTTRIDVTEALEKRVKSRFSHRYVHLALPRGIGQFIEVAKAAVGVKNEELELEEKATLVGKGTSDALKGWNAAVDVSPLFSLLTCFYVASTISVRPLYRYIWTPHFRPLCLYVPSAETILSHTAIGR
jgi:origin recognition complex subunit 4